MHCQLSRGDSRDLEDCGRGDWWKGLLVQQKWRGSGAGKRASQPGTMVKRYVYLRTDKRPTVRRYPSCQPGNGNGPWGQLVIAGWSSSGNDGGQFHPSSARNRDAAETPFTVHGMESGRICRGLCRTPGPCARNLPLCDSPIARHCFFSLFFPFFPFSFFFFFRPIRLIFIAVFRSGGKMIEIEGGDFDSNGRGLTFVKYTRKDFISTIIFEKKIFDSCKFSIC